MTEEAQGPVDNSHKDPAFAAQAPQQAQETQQNDADDQAGGEGEQNTSEQSAATENESAPQKPRGVQKRLDELTRDKHDAKRDAEQARREAEHWREMAMRQQPQQPAQPAQQPKQQSSDEPLFEDYMDVAAYTKAVIKWQKDQDQKAAQQQKAEQEKSERQKKFQDSAQKFSETAPDFAELVFQNPNLPITEVMVDVMTEADNPAAVAYYLAKNPEEAARIAAMSPAGVGRAIGRIESSLSQPAEPTRQPVQRNVTQAPPPPTTLSGAKAPSKKPEEMTMAEYAAHRAEERKAKGLRP